MFSGGAFGMETDVMRTRGMLSLVSPGGGSFLSEAEAYTIDRGSSPSFGWRPL